MLMIFFFDVLIPMGLYVILCYVISYFVNEKNCFIDNICGWLEPAPGSPSDALESIQGYICGCGHVLDQNELKKASGWGNGSIICPGCSKKINLEDH